MERPRPSCWIGEHYDLKLLWLLFFTEWYLSWWGERFSRRALHCDVNLVHLRRQVAVGNAVNVLGRSMDS